MPPVGAADGTSEALAQALLEAAKAGQWEIVAVLSRQLDELRLASIPNVIRLARRRKT